LDVLQDAGGSAAKGAGAWRCAGDLLLDLLRDLRYL
jgi:hypothetical protein